MAGVTASRTVVQGGCRSNRGRRKEMSLVLLQQHGCPCQGPARIGRGSAAASRRQSRAWKEREGGGKKERKKKGQALLMAKSAEQICSFARGARPEGVVGFSGAARVGA